MGTDFEVGAVGIEVVLIIVMIWGDDVDWNYAVLDNSSDPVASLLVSVSGALAFTMYILG